MGGVNRYIATAEAGGQSQSCVVATGVLTCQIQPLSPYTDYTVKLVACDQEADVANRICSNAVVWDNNPVKTLQSGEFSSYPLL